MTAKPLINVARGDDFFGWEVMDWLRVDMGPVTLMITFRKVCPTIDDADEVTVYNGQSTLGHMFCIRNGLMAILPREFSGVATQQ